VADTVGVDRPRDDADLHRTTTRTLHDDPPGRPAVAGHACAMQTIVD
jgi:hypothetical protein